MRRVLIYQVQHGEYKEEQAAVIAGIILTALGKGNYCFCGHNSTIYAEVFTELDQIRIGDEMYLVDIDANRTGCCYIVTEYKIVAPDQTDVLKDYGGDRLTVISCTDDEIQRQTIPLSFEKAKLSNIAKY